MTEYNFINNIYARIKDGINSTTTTIPLYPGYILALLPLWNSSKSITMTITDTSGEKEVVTVTDLDTDASELTVTRGVDNQAWPDGAIITTRLTATPLNAFLQKGAYREIAYNPNGVLSADYIGEKVLQGGQGIWWKNISGTDWQLIAGELATTLTLLDTDDQGTCNQYACPYYDGTFLYVPFQASPCGIWVYSVAIDGTLTLEKTYTITGSFAVRAVWGDGTFLYYSYDKSFDNYLASASVDGSGNISEIDTDDSFSQAPNSIWGDGTFLYTASEFVGLMSWSVDVAGNLTLIDTKDPGGTGRAVWGDGTFIYYAAGTNGLYSYSVDMSGNFTEEDHADPGGTSQGVWGDGTFVYLSGESRGVDSYSVDENGGLTHLGYYDPGGGNSRVTCGNGFILAAGYGRGVEVLTVDESGNLTLDQTVDPGGIIYAIFYHSDFFFSNNYISGVSSYGWE